jgi:hypothetical protein
VMAGMVEPAGFLLCFSVFPRVSMLCGGLSFQSSVRQREVLEVNGAPKRRMAVYLNPLLKL